MRKKVTIVIDNDVDEKLRLIQAKMIKEEESLCSYSRVVNEELRKTLCEK